MGLRENDLAVGKLIITPFDACLGGCHLNAVIVVNNDDLVRIQDLYTFGLVAEHQRTAVFACQKFGRARLPRCERYGP
ncbi:hypothetical protein D3C76_1767510 [compost metagenome]